MDYSTVNAAVKDMRNFSAKFKGFMALADELDKIGDVVAYLHELEAKSKELSGVVLSLQKEYDALQLSINEREATVSELVAKQKKLEQDSVADAKEKGKAVLQKAQEEANKIVESAMVEQARVKQEVAAYAAQAKDLASRVSTGKDELDKVTREVSRLKAAIGGVL